MKFEVLKEEKIKKETERRVERKRTMKCQRERGGGGGGGRQRERERETRYTDRF